MYICQKPYKNGIYLYHETKRMSVDQRKCENIESL